MVSAREFVLLYIVVFSCLVASATAGVQFSSLPRTLAVTVTIISSAPMAPNVAMAGRDQLVVSWWVNESSSTAVSEYKNVEVRLCFAPVSQVDRRWRKSNNDLKKDKTCQFDMSEQLPYSSNIKNNTITWTVQRDVPKGTYFVRAYAFNASGSEVAYGQSTNKNKTSDLFMVEPISGRHASLDIASVVCAAFSIVSLFAFFLLEKWSSQKAAGQKK